MMADMPKCTTCKGSGKMASGHTCQTCGGTGMKTGGYAQEGPACKMVTLLKMAALSKMGWLHKMAAFSNDHPSWLLTIDRSLMTGHQ